MKQKNKTESKNDQSAPSESSERGCTAAKIHATGTGMDLAIGSDWTRSEPWLWSLRSGETTTRSSSK